MEHLSYFKLVLTDFMVQHHPDKIEDTEFINARSGLAEDEFERCSHMGMNVNEAKREALIVLYKDLKFSAYDLVKEIVEEEFDIKYYSSDENVCIIDGSNSVAWICGIDYGNASLTAKIVSRKDNIELASCEMLVSVTVPDPIIPKISLGNSILTVEAGEDGVLKRL